MASLRHVHVPRGSRTSPPVQVQTLPRLTSLSPRLFRLLVPRRWKYARRSTCLHDYREFRRHFRAGDEFALARATLLSTFWHSIVGQILSFSAFLSHPPASVPHHVPHRVPESISGSLSLTKDQPALLPLHGDNRNCLSVCLSVCLSLSLCGNNRPRI